MENFRNIWSDNNNDDGKSSTSSSSFYSASMISNYNNEIPEPIEQIDNRLLSTTNNLIENDSETFSVISGITDQSTTQTNITNSSSDSNVRKKYYETVCVQSSGHVAQIVGKNGSKIKHLRSKYDVYIRTPSSDAEPIFFISGYKHNVLAVKREIINADRHFLMIQKSKNNKIVEKINSQDAIYIRLFIPNKYIGLIVGRNGYFVKNLQQLFKIYVETPKFYHCNYFQLYGPECNVYNAIDKIYEYICKRTGIEFVKKIEQPILIDNNDDNNENEYHYKNHVNDVYFIE